MKNMTANDYYNNRLKPPKNFYEWCYCQMPTYVWKNKKRTIIGSTRKHDYVTEKRLTIKSRLTFFDYKKKFEIVLCSNKRIERQIYEVFSFFENGVQDFRVQLVNLHLFTENNYIKVGRGTGGNYKFGLEPVVGMFNYYYAYPELYPDSWWKKLSTISELRYLNLDDLDPNDISVYYKYRDRLEYIQKMKMEGIEKEFLRGNLDMRIITTNWLKRWKLYLRNSTRTFKNVELKKEIERTGGKMAEGIEPFLEASDIKNLPTEMSLVRFQNYLIRQQKSFNYYCDYINLLEEIKIPVTNKRRFPKNLVEAHNEAVETLNSIKREIVRKEFEQRAKKLSQLETTINGFTFLLPKSANEVMDEGKALSHCVGSKSYIDSHAEGHTTLVFVRKANKKEKPYFTIEYKDERIKQLQGYNNIKKVPSALRSATDEWLKMANKLRG